MVKEEQMVIYQITNIINDKKYIGSAINYDVRIKRHLNDLKVGRHHSSKLQRFYDKYGKEVFNFEIIEIVTNIDLLIEIEQKWLTEKQPEFNMTLIAGLNSHLGVKRSQETKDKISVKLTGISRSQETKDKISKSKLGVSIDGTNMNKDKIGVPLSITHKENIRLSLLGRVISEEQKKQISETLKSKKLISAVAITVKKYSLNNELLDSYSSMDKAEIANGYGRGTLRYHLINKNKKEYNGFKWEVVKSNFYK
jgi:group I intron endonuclease